MDFTKQQLISSIFDPNLRNFDELCLQIFRYQYQFNEVYRKYCQFIAVNDPHEIQHISQIPFLPITFFKSHTVLSTHEPAQIVFSSSATGGMGQSKHLVSDLSLYHQSSQIAFEQNFGMLKDYCFLALLPSYLEREGSSLIYMVQQFMNASKHPLNGFFLYEYETLKNRIEQLERMNQNYVVFGVSFALLDFAEQAGTAIKTGKVIETGGMKGRKKELTKMEVYSFLKQALQTESIYSEYGMTELLSQVYSDTQGNYRCNPWMRVLISDPNDPFHYLGHQKTGLINMIDLANINSCCFIQTSDLGRTYANGTFEVLGRLDHSDLRGCSLLIA